MASQKHESSRRQVAEPRLVSICTEVLTKFISIDKKLSAREREGAKVGLEASREVQMFYPIVVRILTAFETAPAPFFRSNLVWLWPLLAKLVRVLLDGRAMRERCFQADGNVRRTVLAAGVEKLQ